MRPYNICSPVVTFLGFFGTSFIDPELVHSKLFEMNQPQIVIEFWATRMNMVVIGGHFHKTTMSEYVQIE